MRKVLVQSGVAFVIGMVLWVAGEYAGLFPEFLVPAGVVLTIAGAIGFILGLIIREPQEGKTGGGT